MVKGAGQVNKGKSRQVDGNDDTKNDHGDQLHKGDEDSDASQIKDKPAVYTASVRSRVISDEEEAP